MLLVAAILLTAVFLFLLPFLHEAGSSVEILLAETGEVQTHSLDTPGVYEVASRGYTLTVQVADGRVSVSHSDCRDGICRNTPPISRAGQSIVCAPAGVVVRIVGKGAVVDGVSG